MRLFFFIQFLFLNIYFCVCKNAKLYSLQEDTLRISISQADSLFLKKNYRLLAAEMNINAYQAQILQARLFQDPFITAEFNAYDGQNYEVAHVGKTGEKAFMLQQLLLVGGKRKVQIDLAKTNVQIAELEFQDLIRNIKFELHSCLYLLNQQTFLINKYNIQLSLIDTIISAYELQSRRGNLPLKDVVRLKGAYLNLSSDRAEVYSKYLEQLEKARTILQTDKIIYPAINDPQIDTSLNKIKLEELLQVAEVSRPDLLIIMQNKLLAQQYFTYQKKLAIPDLNLYTGYDQRGGAFVNQVNVGVNMGLPLWNKNRGNIKAAGFQQRVAAYEADGFKNQVHAEIATAYTQLNQTVNEYRKARQLYNKDFEITLKGMSDNFRKGNVSLLEFVDFFEGYNNALAELSRIKTQLAISAQQINLSTGKEIF